ncbi:MAG: hypothetical protein U0002_03335 [Thermoanaerobaculia bacterium]
MTLRLPAARALRLGPATLAACLALLLGGACSWARPQPAEPGSSRWQLLRRLPGAGPVAFHPRESLLAWAEGERLSWLELPAGAERSLLLPAAVSDLRFDPNGRLWVAVGEDVVVFEGESEVSRFASAGASRFVGETRSGMVARAETYLDGFGPAERVLRFRLPAEVEAEPWQALSPPGERGPPRLVLQARGWVAEGQELRSASDGRQLERLPAPAVAASSEGRFWLLGEPGALALWELRPPGAARNSL